ncbi:RNA polymerase sigma factor [Steroidobacter sp.]|uniref:RNA polymerase sigma factor n=1 Tax=Steroidobacter sp. TaxID=1978227 RepID=UPI001A3D17F1|nr:sigma-70 family RNA polymerase sigma factor [Steroidobacter sp.]MBL8267766.1 sigma-70 family RNA polymerase sigma factor [Steroidobacter sp.]
MSAPLNDWFTREILPHEEALLRYLARICPNPADIQDIRHDAYVRILQAADRYQPIAPKALLFQTARRLVIDRARRRRIVPIDLKGDLDELNLLVDGVTPERRLSIRQQLIAVTAAFNGLPERCREALWLRKIEGCSQKEIAARLGVSEATVEKHLMRGVRLLADFLSERRLTEDKKPGASGAADGVVYGE